MTASLIQKLVDAGLTPKSVAAALALLLIAASYMLGISHGHIPKEVLCKEEISLVDVQQHKIKQMLEESHTRTQRAQLECVKREQDVCSERLDTFRRRLTELKCKICEHRGAK